MNSDSILSNKSVLALLTGEPRLLLKVGLMQAFTTMMLMAWFGGVYYGQESWSSAAAARGSSNVTGISTSITPTWRSRR